jgi:acetyl esterase/lipase
MGSVEFAEELGSELNQGAADGFHRSPDQSDRWWMGLVKFAGAAGMPWQTCEQCRLRPDYAEDTIMPPLGSPEDKFGPSDLSKVAADFDAKSQQAYGAADNPIARYIDGPAGSKGLFESPTASGPANPLSCINGSSPPFLLLHGDHDTLVSPSQTLILHERLRAAGVQSTRYVLKGAGHGDMAMTGDLNSGLPWSTNQVMGLIVDFLRRTLD